MNICPGISVLIVSFTITGIASVSLNVNVKNVNSGKSISLEEASMSRTMGKLQRQRGKQFEYRIVRLARKCGLSASRVVLSGAAREKGDVVIAGRRFECKYRSNGLTTLRKWVDKAIAQNLCGVILGGYRMEPLVVMPARDFFALLAIMRKLRGLENGESREL